jgi:hypothetical protein
MRHYLVAILPSGPSLRLNSLAPIKGSAWAGDTSLLSDISEVRAAIASCRSHITASVFKGPAVTLHTKIPPSTSIDPSKTHMNGAVTFCSG